MRGVVASPAMATRLPLLACAMLAAVLGVHAQEVRRALPLPDVPGFELLRADLHLHSVFSDGEVWPTVHVREAWRDGLDVIALSEHREYRPHARDLEGGSRRAYELARPLADRLGLVLVPAVEITRPVPGEQSPWPVGSAHFNALFVTDEEPLGDPDLPTALRTAQAQGAFVFWNHPAFMGRRAEWYPHVAQLFEAGLFAGIEVVNGDEFSPEAFGWALDRQLTVLACSDAHLPMPAHLRSQGRPITLLFARSRDAEAVREALVERRTVAWLDHDLWGEEGWLRALWERALRVRHRGVVQPGRELVLEVENPTAIDFHVVPETMPGWLVLGELRAPPQGTVIWRGRVTPDAPPGPQEVRLGVNVRNMHPRPGQGLDTTMTVTLAVTPASLGQ
jgi:3',5'-nucleoside bisphosphate phosphatase